jgi:HSP20 family molecular chaperone IbpA
VAGLLKYKREEPIMTVITLRSGKSNTFGRSQPDVVSCRCDKVLPDTPTGWVALADLAETDDAYEYQVELPGLNREQIKVTVEDQVLAIQGDKKVARDSTKKNYYCSERQSGPFRREFRLPKYVHTGKLKAEYRDGVLTVTIPKTEEGKLREITVL